VGEAVSWLDALVHGAGVAPAPDDVRPDAQVYAYDSLRLTIDGLPLDARSAEDRAPRRRRPKPWESHTCTVVLKTSALDYSAFARAVLGLRASAAARWRRARRGLRKGLRRTERREARRHGTT
jgi:hypothetical protein